MVTLVFAAVVPVKAVPVPITTVSVVTFSGDIVRCHPQALVIVYVVCVPLHRCPRSPLWSLSSVLSSSCVPETSPVPPLSPWQRAHVCLSRRNIRVAQTMKLLGSRLCTMNVFAHGL